MRWVVIAINGKGEIWSMRFEHKAAAVAVSDYLEVLKEPQQQYVFITKDVAVLPPDGSAL
jgi:hypothetical protein